MIPRDYITEWRAQAPWVQDIQVEQDLVICRAIVELFAHPAIYTEARNIASLNSSPISICVRQATRQGRRVRAASKVSSNVSGTEAVLTNAMRAPSEEISRTIQSETDDDGYVMILALLNMRVRCSRLHSDMARP